MAEIRLPVAGHPNATVFWSDYTAKLIREVVYDWAGHVEVGDLKRFRYDDSPISAEHLRIAKSFLKPVLDD